MVKKEDLKVGMWFKDASEDGVVDENWDGVTYMLIDEWDGDWFSTITFNAQSLVINEAYGAPQNWEPVDLSDCTDNIDGYASLELITDEKIIKKLLKYCRLAMI